jgi:hypothetical protein
MAIERWGSLSVKDHKDVHALVANVLMYDRLVIPMCTEADDRDERAYWLEHDWDPDGQRMRRAQLGDLAIECAWDKPRRTAFTDRYKAASAVNAEVNGEAVTRWLLTNNHGYELPSGVNHADVFVAYNSESSAQEEMPRTKVETTALVEGARVGVLIAQQLGVPDIPEPEVALNEAMALARDVDFRRRREDMYDFQMTCLNRGMSAKAVVAELRDRNRELITFMEKQKIPVRKKTAFMLAQTFMSALAGVFASPAGAIGGLLTVWQFAKFDAAPEVLPPNRLQPVAAFHDIDTKLGLHF